MKVLTALVLVASMLSVASAATVCKGYTVVYTATDIKWAQNSITAYLTSQGVAFTTLVVGKAGTATFTVTVDSSKADALTAGLAALGVKDKFITSIKPATGLCRTVAPTFQCVKVTFKSGATDYKWLLVEIPKWIAQFKAAYPGCVVSTTAPVKATGPAGFSYASVTFTVACSGSRLKTFVATSPRLPNIISQTTAACGLVAPVVVKRSPKPSPPSPPIAAPVVVKRSPKKSPRFAPVVIKRSPKKSPRGVAPTLQCKSYTVRAVAGDYAWIKNDVAKALAGLAGVTYTITPASGLAGYTYATLTITAPSSLWPTIQAKLKPTKYIKAYSAPGLCVAPAVQACVKFSIVAKAGDFAWVKSAMDKLKVTFLATYPGSSWTLTQTTGPAGATYATLVVRYSSPAALAWLKANVKPDAYINTVTAGSC